MIRKKTSKKPVKKAQGKKSPLLQVQKRSFAGGLLAVAAFAFCSRFAFWGMGVLFAPLFLFVGCMKLDLPRIRWNYLANLLWGLAVIALTSIMPNAMVSTWPQDMGWHAILNVLCVTIVCGVILILTARFKLSVALTAILLTILVLEFVVPDYQEGHLFEAILGQWPIMFAYVLTFTYMGSSRLRV